MPGKWSSARLATQGKRVDEECFTCPLPECLPNHSSCPIFPKGADGPVAAAYKREQKALKKEEAEDE